MENRGVKGVIAIVLSVLLVLAAGCSSGEKDSASEAPMADAADKMAVSSESKAGQPGAVAVNDQYGTAKVLTDADKAQAGANAVSNSTNPAPVPSGFTGAAETSKDGLNRKLIYKGNLVMEVKDYSFAQSEIRNLVALSGGYILQFTENSTKHEEGSQFVLKIPSAGFSSFMDNLEKIPNESIQRKVEGQDVSEEYVDLEARLKAKQVTEARYLDFMQKAQRTDDLVAFTNELGRVQQEIEQIKGRMRYIDQNVAYSTVELRVYQPGKSMKAEDGSEPEHMLSRAKDSLMGSFGFLSGFGQGLVVLLAGLLPILAVLLIIGWPLWRIYRKQQEKRKIREEEKTSHDDNG